MSFRKHAAFSSLAALCALGLAFTASPAPARAAAAAAGSPSAAAPAEPGHKRDELAKYFLDQGIAAYQQGHYTEALTFFHKADARGHSKAARYLGLCYEYGLGVPRSMTEAAQWFKKAAGAGDVTGTYLLGLLYERGEGVKQDAQKAYELFYRSSYRSDHVSAPSQAALGRMYERGEGRAKDPAAARSWYTRAAASGSDEAMAALERLDGKVRPVLQRVTEGKDTDIVDGVTRIDTSEIWTPAEWIDFSPKHAVEIRNADGSLLPMDQPYFEAVQIAPSTWQLRNDGDHCYLIAGDNYGVLIDSGYGAWNLRAFASALIQKPVPYVINTHYHFDHTANDAYFDAAFMTKESVPYATVPYASFDGIEFPRDYPIVTVDDGYRLNLGNRELTIIRIPHPNHALGGIAILDRKERILFSGDEFLSGKRMDLTIPLSDFAENMAHLSQYSDAFDVLYTGPGSLTKEDFTALCRAAAYGISPECRAEPAAASAPRRTPSAETGAAGNPIYTRGHVRPGDATKNAPEKPLQGKKYSYTYDGVTVQFVKPE